MIPQKFKTALELLEVWYKAKLESEQHEQVAYLKSLKRKWRRNQLFFKAKGLVAHDQHLNGYPRRYD